MSKPEHILRQEGAVKRPDFCTCDDGYWMRNLIDPGCHYHGDYADTLRELITVRLKAADAIKESAIRDLCAIAREKNQLITELCDALSRSQDSATGYLIQRAREAARLSEKE